MFPKGMNKLKFLRNEIKPLRECDKKLINILYKNKIINIDKDILNIWYRQNRYNINKIFNELMITCNGNNVYIYKPYQIFYDKFVEFCYKNSYLKRY